MLLMLLALQGPHITDLACTALAQRLRAERPRQLARRAWLVNTLGEQHLGHSVAWKARGGGALVAVQITHVRPYMADMHQQQQKVQSCTESLQLTA
jgi:hypothetical protein